MAMPTAPGRRGLFAKRRRWTMAKRRTPGEGSIGKKRKDGRYPVRIALGVGPDGERGGRRRKGRDARVIQAPATPAPETPPLAARAGRRPIFHPRGRWQAQSASGTPPAG